MKFLVRLTILTFILSVSLSAKILKDHLWKHRIIIVFTEQDLSKEWKNTKEKLTDRHLIYYQINNKNQLVTNQKEQITLDSIKAIREKYYQQSDQPTQVILIGKDGGIKNRSNKLDLDALYALIDTMPMRIQEMRGTK